MGARKNGRMRGVLKWSVCCSLGLSFSLKAGKLYELVGRSQICYHLMHDDEFLIIILLQVIFKCCKLIPVMIGGIIIQGELILYFLLSGFVGYYILADFLSQRWKKLFYSDNMQNHLNKIYEHVLVRSIVPCTHSQKVFGNKQPCLWMFLILKLRF